MPTPNLDATSSNKITNNSTLTWSHTTGTNSNMLLVVAVQAYHNPGVTVSTITYGAASLAKIPSASTTCNINSITGSGDVELWYVLAPPSGAATITVNMSNIASDIIAGASTYYNVAQSSTFGTAQVASGMGTTSVTVTATGTATSQIVVDSVAADNTLTVGGSQTQIYDLTGSNIAGGSSFLTGAVTNTVMSWTPPSNVNFGIVAVPVNVALVTATMASTDVLTGSDVGALQSWNVDALSISDSGVLQSWSVDALTATDLGVLQTWNVDGLVSVESPLVTDSAFATVALTVADLQSAASWPVDALSTSENMSGTSILIATDALTATDGLLTTQSFLALDAANSADSALMTATTLAVDSLTPTDTVLAIESMLASDVLTLTDSLLIVGSASATEAAQATDTSDVQSWLIETLVSSDALLATSNGIPSDVIQATDTHGLQSWNVDGLSSQSAILSTGSVFTQDGTSGNDSQAVIQNSSASEPLSINENLLCTTTETAVDSLLLAEAFLVSSLMTLNELAISSDFLASLQTTTFLESVSVPDGSLFQQSFFCSDSLSIAESIQLLPLSFVSSVGLIAQEMVLVTQVLGVSDSLILSSVAILSSLSTALTPPATNLAMVLRAGQAYCAVRQVTLNLTIRQGTLNLEVRQ